MRIEMPEEVLKNNKRTEYFKFSEGDNRIRIVSPMIHFKNYFGNDPTKTPSSKGLCFVIRYDTMNVKGQALVKETLQLAKLPLTIAKYVLGLSKDPEGLGEGDIVPFIINIKATKAGTKEVKYEPTPARKSTDITEEVKELIKDLNIDETARRLKEFRDNAFEDFGKANPSLAKQKDPELPTISVDTEEEPKVKIDLEDEILDEEGNTIPF